jgi:hypothetical protein
MDYKTLTLTLSLGIKGEGRRVLLLECSPSFIPSPFIYKGEGRVRVFAFNESYSLSNKD